MPDDTLKQRAEKFRGGVWKGFAPEYTEALIAEIKWARENPPFESLEGGELSQTFSNGLQMGWQSFADHLLACLGEK